MLNKALRKRSTEKARRKVLKKTLRKVILLNEELKIVFLLKKAFPKKMILECTNIFNESKIDTNVNLFQTMQLGEGA